MRARREAAIALLGSLAAGACQRPLLPPSVQARAEREAAPPQMASLEALSLFEAPADEPYRIGRGDRLAVNVWGRPELSATHVVGPDGVITLPLLGSLRIEQLTRDDAAGSITDAYRRFYTEPVVDVRVDDYAANRVFILGRVGTSGALRFDSTITLLEALTRAASLPVGGAGSEFAALNRCAVFRGREKVVWVDLQALLSGREPALNLRLRPNDVIYLPDSEDQSVMVLGEVMRPGAYRITPDMHVLDALAKAGGATKDGSGAVRFIRTSQKVDAAIPIQDLFRRPELNVMVEEGDVLYVARSGLAKFGYILQQLSGGLTVLLLGQALTGSDTTPASSGTDGGTGDTGAPRPVP
ncbi:MAG: polysaccharide biosynthesis/export family protein [Vicinamibacteria bacterium]